MGSALRLSERWFRLALWLVALVFAGFLIGLGSLLVDDLPHVERRFTLEQFLDRPQDEAAASALKQTRRAQEDNRRKTAEARLALDAARAATAAEQASFANWLKTRNATQRVDQDPGLVERTQRLDSLKAAERAIEEQLEAIDRSRLTLTEREGEQARAQDDLRAQAGAKLAAEEQRQDLRVFAYRLALTLPLLVLAGWLLLKRRHTRNWPFVWGFAFAAAYCFFVELVPYLPSYGGYVRYGVGLIVTLIMGRAAIKALQAYGERQRAEEARPDVQRRVEIIADQAFARLARKACPGCERPIALDGATNFCPHCGIGVFERCPSCGERKSTFARFCHACGQRTANAVSVPA